ncbi:MAG: hypothetical protein FJ291_19250 [Planctomycetes bacterium]|nr:hypothetical protein [Planctomycetota bacterium]
MFLEPRDWSVVVVARWNPAILTPAGIGKYVFGLPPGRDMEVYVPVDGLSPHIVRHPDGGIRVMLEHSRLKIELEERNYENLERAKVAAQTALRELPVTPAIAAGINVYFASKDPLLDCEGLLSSQLDDRLTDAAFEIVARSSVRTLRFQDGKLNLSIIVNEGGSTVMCNFHRESQNHDDLIAWLGLPVNDISSTVEKLLAALELPLQEATDVLAAR